MRVRIVYYRRRPLDEYFGAEESASAAGGDCTIGKHEVVNYGNETTPVVDCAEVHAKAASQAYEWVRDVLTAAQVSKLLPRSMSTQMSRRFENSGRSMLSSWTVLLFSVNRRNVTCPFS